MDIQIVKEPRIIAAHPNPTLQCFCLQTKQARHSREGGIHHRTYQIKANSLKIRIPVMDSRLCGKDGAFFETQIPNTPPYQNGLTITNITMIAAAIPGTSLAKRSFLSLNVRWPRASFLA